MALLTVNFILRTDKRNSKGEYPILMTVYVSNQMKRLSTGINILPQHWDAESKRAIYLNKQAAKQLLPGLAYNALPTQEDINNINNELLKLKKGLFDKAKQFELENVSFSVDMLVNRFKEANSPKVIKEQPRKFLTDFIANYIVENSATLNFNTAKGYKTLKAHLEDYEADRETKITISGADYSFMQSFYNFLISQKNHLNATAGKQITKTKAFLNRARKTGFEISNTFQDYTIKRDDMEVIALTNWEFAALFNLDLSGNGTVAIPIKTAGKESLKTVSYKTLDKVKDLFIFGCVTGLRYSDLVGFKRENIKDGFLSITVTKTKKPLNVPLIGIATEILSKYQGQIDPLPTLSNQKFNQYIKEIAKLAGIDESIQIKRYSGNKEICNTYPKHEIISVHTARKTFVTLSLGKSMNTEYIMSITGHKSYTSFKRYVNVTPDKAKEAMSNAWEPGVNLKIINGGLVDE